MKHTISVLVENHAGVLSRISGLFTRRGFNIDSLAVGVTDDPDISRITIIVTCDEHMTEQVEKQLNKLIEVLKVKTIPDEELIARELMIVKLSADASARRDILTVAEVMEAKILDITPTTLTLQLADVPQQLERFVQLVEPYGILEIARTGTIALQKGSDTLSFRGKV